MLSACPDFLASPKFTNHIRVLVTYPSEAEYCQLESKTPETVQREYETPIMSPKDKIGGFTLPQGGIFSQREPSVIVLAATSAQSAPRIVAPRRLRVTSLVSNQKSTRAEWNGRALVIGDFLSNATCMAIT